MPPVVTSSLPLDHIERIIEAPISSLAPEWVAQFLASGFISAQGNHAWVAWGLPSRAATPDHEQFSVYAPDFFLTDPTPWQIFPSFARVEIASLKSALQSTVQNSDALEWQPNSKTEFALAFNAIQAEINAGTLQKAVPITQIRSDRGLEAGALAKALLHALDTANGFPLNTYGVWQGGSGILGLTPEILFEQTDLGWKTMALAGTYPASESGRHLLEDAKETMEHHVVVEGIIAQLGEFGDVTIGTTGELHLPTLTHLSTDIFLHPSIAVSFEAMVAALHPTAAIGAWPKRQGWDWLKASQGAEDRGRFGAPFGYILPVTAAAELATEPSQRCLVAIRNVQWDEHSSAIFAGCGVIGMSQLDREWEELLAKAHSTREALAI